MAVAKGKEQYEELKSARNDDQIGPRFRSFYLVLAIIAAAGDRVQNNRQLYYRATLVTVLIAGRERTFDHLIAFIIHFWLLNGHFTPH